MRLIITLIALLVVFVYLHFAFARFYNFIGAQNLTSPIRENFFSIKNPQGGSSLKYVALGDSLSAGVGSEDPQQTLVYQYALHLAENVLQVDVVNLAVPGATTEDVIQNQIPAVIAQQPDYITLLIGINDLHNRVPPETFRSNFKVILSHLITQTKANILIMNLPYLGSGKLVYPPYNFLLDYRTKQFNDIIADLSTEKRIHLVNLYGAPVIYSSDQFHPSGAGYMIWRTLINAN